jgi:DNA-binding transcriptional ArsR family regulator
MRMARPKWTPDTDEQRRAIAAVAAAAEVADEADGKLGAAIAKARALDVPVSHLAEAAGRSRPTIYRHLSPTEDE